MYPTWVRTLLAGITLAVVAWSLQDRLAIEVRSTTVTEWLKSVDKRLERIESKIDEGRRNADQRYREDR